MAEGKITIDTDRCKGCGICIQFCPKGILYLDSSGLNAIGYTTVALNTEGVCAGCGNCAIMCPDSVFTVVIV